MQAFSPITIVVCGIVIIVLAMVVGPVFSPPEFSWLRHSTSEQAGQNTQGAWIMRVGFYAYGLTTIFAVLLDWSSRPFVRAALLFFGIGLIGAAYWSHAPINTTWPSSENEDFLHSVASGLVGTSFAFACVARLYYSWGISSDRLSWIGLFLAITIPLVMVALPSIAGMLQRVMFFYSFVFLVREFGSQTTTEEKPDSVTG